MSDELQNHMNRWKAHWYVFLNVKNSMQTSMKLLSLNTTTNFNLQSEFVETVLFMGAVFLLSELSSSCYTLE